MKNPPVVERLEIRYQDLDPYGHVNNAIYLVYFETLRIVYWRALAEKMGLVEEMVAGDIPGARYVVAETSVRYKVPIFFEDTLHGAVSIGSIGNRSYAMDFELRTGESFENGVLAAEGSAAQVFYDPVKEGVQPRPDWFLPAVAELEGSSEESFAPEGR